ncbi:hypothetical protein OG607_14940 [Streptomyces sp. NBC_01537]|uniref:hypothetical protein n=1 Tax=Streptomyces sp. NBC_01537 TaxID=2903896 RepID=UPI00386C8573
MPRAPLPTRASRCPPITPASFSPAAGTPPGPSTGVPPPPAPATAHPRFLRWTRIAVDNASTPPSHLSSVAEALRLLTADLVDPRDPQPALALEACGLAADVHLRLYAHDEAAHRQDYERAMAELVSLGLAAGDQATANAALDRLSRLRRS